MTCHWKAGYDYGAFNGGKECGQAFDPRVGTVDSCASCHRNHGTPYQWAEAKNGRLRYDTPSLVAVAALARAHTSGRRQPARRHRNVP
jgi:hypothetical protein